MLVGVRNFTRKLRPWSGFTPTRAPRVLREHLIQLIHAPFPSVVQSEMLLPLAARQAAPRRGVKPRAAQQLAPVPDAHQEQQDGMRLRGGAKRALQQVAAAPAAALRGMGGALGGMLGTLGTLGGVLANPLKQPRASEADLDSLSPASLRRRQGVMDMEVDMEEESSPQVGGRLLGLVVGRRRRQRRSAGRPAWVMLGNSALPHASLLPSSLM